MFTRREVVDLILDLVGYEASSPLHRRRLLEPSMGAGDFLLPAIGRLLDAYELAPDHGPRGIVADLGGCIRAVELHAATHRATRRLVVEALVGRGLAGDEAEGLSDAWLGCGDFLLTRLDGTFSHVVGNPPYVRQEMVPDALMAEYRRRFTTIFDRADLYVPFIERSLSLLAPDGRMGFICADRWMKNRYGGPLRKMVADGFRLRHFIDMVGTPAFHSDVTAYPAVIVIGREAPGPTRVAFRPEINASGLRRLAGAMAADTVGDGTDVTELASIGSGSEPWMLGDAGQLRLVRRLEASLPTLEQSGCKVGIGVATGADRAFIGPFDDLDVEPDRKLRLATTRDIATGTVRWRGLGVVNPFSPGGGLVPLSSYPRMAAHLERHAAAVRARHVSRRNPGSWYRTIDRIDPALASRPKLLIPDIKGSALVVFEDGLLYPHHNLYHVTSDVWDLRALQAVLSSDVARLFVSLYSTRMRGGYLRFQAQYLRRIRLPCWPMVPPPMRHALAAAARRGDMEACNSIAMELYGLTPAERGLLDGMDWLGDGA